MANRYIGIKSRTEPEQPRKNLVRTMVIWAAVISAAVYISGYVGVGLGRFFYKLI